MTEERYGPWSVRWRRDGFAIHDPEGNGDSFLFASIILPIQLVFLLATPEPGRALLKTERGPAQVLTGAPKGDLERFKQKVSMEVLANVRKSASACSDCAKEAGLIATKWEQSPCPGCRESYCKNHQCLRRLRTVVNRHKLKVCKYCGTESHVVA
jgi:hypothetical protein